MCRLLCAALAVTALLSVACYGDDMETRAGASGGPSFPQGQVLIDTGDDSVLIDVEIADDEEHRRVGLMNRTSLAPDAGMVFVFFEETTTSFWMKDTLIPLSVAFFGEDGKIIDIQDMDPCTKEPCPTFGPDAPYRGALEVNQGAFDRWKVSVGDQLTLLHPND